MKFYFNNKQIEVSDEIAKEISDAAVSDCDHHYSIDSKEGQGFIDGFTMGALWMKAENEQEIHNLTAQLTDLYEEIEESLREELGLKEGPNEKD